MREFRGNLRNTVVVFVLLLTIAAGAAWAEEALRFANIFGDNMVLQCDKPVRIWGRAEPGAEVTVTFTEDRKFAKGYLEEASPPADADLYRVTQEVIEHNRPAFKPQTSKANRIEQILSEFQDDDWMRRHIQKANPQIAKEIEQLQAEIRKLKAEIGKMEE